MTICKNSNCNKHPTFNYKNEKTALYCNQHKLDDMIDIKYKSCFEPTKKTGLLNPVKKLLDKRLKKLSNTIKENLNTIPKSKITNIKLFYDL
jgi:hypothetical protein